MKLSKRNNETLLTTVNILNRKTFKKSQPWCNLQDEDLIHHPLGCNSCFQSNSCIEKFPNRSSSHLVNSLLLSSYMKDENHKNYNVHKLQQQCSNLHIANPITICIKLLVLTISNLPN